MIAAVLLAAFASAAPVEVSATSGPVKLTLTVHKTELRDGERPWVKLAIQNVGDKVIRFYDDAFRPDGEAGRALLAQYSAALGVSVETGGSKGEEEAWFFPIPDIDVEVTCPAGTKRHRYKTFANRHLVRLEPGQKVVTPGWCEEPLCKKEGVRPCRPVRGYIEGVLPVGPINNELRAKMLNAVFEGADKPVRYELDFHTPSVDLNIKP